VAQHALHVLPAFLLLQMLGFKCGSKRCGAPAASGSDAALVCVTAPAFAVHFTTPKLQESAGLIGKEAPHLYTLARDGALYAWTYRKTEAAAAPAAAEAAGAVGRKRRRLGEEGPEDEDEEGGSSSSDSEDEGDRADGEEEQDAAAGAAAGQAIQLRRRQQGQQQAAGQQQSHTFAGGHWKLTEKHYFNQRGAKLSAAAFQGPVGLLAVGFSNGVFELLQLPDLTTVHTLSIGRERLSSLEFNAAGDWIAVGSAQLGQLLVWEWRSETYVLKQQGHFYDVAASAFSPEGAYLVTGADDAKVGGMLCMLRLLCCDVVQCGVLHLPARGCPSCPLRWAGLGAVQLGWVRRHPMCGQSSTLLLIATHAAAIGPCRSRCGRCPMASASSPSQTTRRPLPQCSSCPGGPALQPMLRRPAGAWLPAVILLVVIHTFSGSHQSI
jgi:hypothetical protein